MLFFGIVLIVNHYLKMVVYDDKDKLCVSITTSGDIIVQGVSTKVI